MKKRHFLHVSKQATSKRNPTITLLMNKNKDILIINNDKNVFATLTYGSQNRNTQRNF